jgi:hypothetical protein
MDKAYIVKYQGGSWDNYYNANVFVTLSEETAKKYTDKANKMLLRWKEYYKKFEDKSGYYDTDVYGIDNYMRWHELKNITDFYFDSIKFK